MMLLPELLLRGQQYLRPDPPTAVVGTSLVVKLFPLQARHRVRNRKPPSLVTILGSMTRKGLTRPNSTQVWAACHQYRKTDGTLLMTVADTPAAQAAAREAVAAGHVTVGDGDTAILVPVSWAPTTQPAGCTVVTLHQLPPQYAREKVGTTLLAAAQQQGKVVAEFLGGSALMGDAQLTCPAADTVVLWVRPPPDDPLLTRLPTSFDSGVPGSPPVRIEVAGRPSLAPHTWPQLTQQLLRRKQLTLDSIYEDGDAAAATPPSTQQEQQRDQRQQQQQHQQPQQQQQQASSQHQQQQQQARPQQQRAEPQQSPAPQPPARQQQSEGGAATDMQVDSQSESDAAGLPDDPFGTQHHLQQRVLLQVNDMFMIAEVLVGDDAAGDVSSLSDERKLQLQHAFCNHFSMDLQGEGPPEDEVRAWLREQLGIRRLEYGSESGDASDADAAAGPSGATPAQQQQQQHSTQQRSRQRRKGRAQQQQQQQQQEPQQQQQQQQEAQQTPPPRRTGRANAGQLSASYRAVQRLGMQPDSTPRQSKAAATTGAGGNQ